MFKKNTLLFKYMLASITMLLTKKQEILKLRKSSVRASRLCFKCEMKKLNNGKLTAPDECLPHIKKFRKKHVPNTIPG